MITMINFSAEVADPMLAAELLRRRWQEKRPYFSLPRVKPMRNLHAMWRRQPGRTAPVMHWSDLHDVKT